MNCHEALQWLGADPSAAADRLPTDVQAHLANCPDCQRYAQEMRSLNHSIKRALEVDLSRFQGNGKSTSNMPESNVPASNVQALRPRAATATPQRRMWALAASVVLSVGVGFGLWALRSEASLASQVVEHLAEEPASWHQTVAVGNSALETVLRRVGMRISDAHTPVVYAHDCRFRGHTVPHLVVSTDQGPVTVMLLRSERITSPHEFSEGGYRGVLWPSPDGHGGIAVLVRAAQRGDLVAQARSFSAQLSEGNAPAASTAAGPATH